LGFINENEDVSVEDDVSVDVDLDILVNEE